MFALLKKKIIEKQNLKNQQLVFVLNTLNSKFFLLHYFIIFLLQTMRQQCLNSDHDLTTAITCALII